MTFLRTVVLLFVTATSTWVFAADNRASAPNLPFVTDSSPTFFAKPSPDQARPWFSGMQGANPRMKTMEGTYQFAPNAVVIFRAMRPSDVCLSMRTYKVARTERLADNDSGSRGYMTCQMASNYHVRTTGRIVVSLPEQ